MKKGKVCFVFKKKISYQFHENLCLIFFLGRLDNSDIADQLNNQLATACVQYWNYLNQLLKDDMKMALANTFLISQGLPSIKPKKITESVFNLVDKSIKSFTSFKIDLQEARDETLKQFATIEKEYVTSKEFAKLTEKEQVTLVSRFLSENLLEPLQFIWRAHTHINGHQDGKKCAESILCHLNAHMRDQGICSDYFNTYKNETLVSRKNA